MLATGVAVVKMANGSERVNSKTSLFLFWTPSPRSIAPLQKVLCLSWTLPLSFRWDPISIHHSGLKDHHRAVDRSGGLSCRSKRLYLRFAHSGGSLSCTDPQLYNGPILFYFLVSAEKCATWRLSQHFRAFSKARENLARHSLVKITSMPWVWAGEASDQHCNTSSTFGSVGRRASALCKAEIKLVTGRGEKGFVVDSMDIQQFLLQKTQPWYSIVVV